MVKVSFSTKIKTPLFLVSLILFYAIDVKIIKAHTVHDSGMHSSHQPRQPSEEYLIEKDGYLIHLLVFQHKQSDSTIRVKAVAMIKEKQTGELYFGKPLKMALYKKSIFGLKEYMRLDIHEDFEKRYPFYVNISDEADFKVVLSFNGKDNVVSAEFPMRVGEPKYNLIFTGIISFIFISFVIAAVYLIIRQRAKT